MTCTEFYETLSPEDETYFVATVMDSFDMALGGIRPSSGEALSMLEDAWSQFPPADIPSIAADLIAAGQKIVQRRARAINRAD
jgi:hypothetical protein